MGVKFRIRIPLPFGGVHGPPARTAEERHKKRERYTIGEIRRSNFIKER
jgi:hypothetical protein